MARIKIPVSFAYVNGSALDPVVGTTVSVISRTTQLPATVYQAESESNPATYNTLATDSQGNVPGWVEPGSYQVTAAAQGGFGGSTAYFEAVRGDGVTNIATAAIDMAQLAQDVLNALVPTGTILDTIAPTAPAGFIFGDGSVYPTGSVGSTYYNLSQVCGTRWNTGGEGTGNFRVPDLRGVTLMGAGQNAHSGITTSSYSLAAVGGAENVALTNVNQLPPHNHGITDPGHAHSVYDPSHAHSVADPGHSHSAAVATGLTALQYWVGSFQINGSSPYAEWLYNAAGGASVSIGASGTGIGIYGAYTGISIYSAGTGISVNSSGSSATHPNISPFVVTNRIIKL